MEHVKREGQDWKVFLVVPQAELCPDVSGSCLVGVDSLLVVERPHGVPLVPFESSPGWAGAEMQLLKGFYPFPQRYKEQVRES